MKKRLTIFALGGNELSPAGIIDPVTGKIIFPDLAGQWKKTADTCELLAKIISKNPDGDYIVTHGNGPQVGNLIMNSKSGTVELDVCDADTQGSMGYMLSQLTNSLRIIGVNKIAAETLTKVLVDESDPAFSFPTKFIGPSYSKEEAFEKAAKENRPFRYYKKDGNNNELWRWVVPSPPPLEIVEIDLIEANLQAGMIPIVVGGGGVPVRKVKPEIINDEEIYFCKYGIQYKRKYSIDNLPVNIYTGVNAVIDKDLASSLLGKTIIEKEYNRGNEVEASLCIFTNIDGVKLNYQQPDQKDLIHLKLSEIESLFNHNIFPEGSMAPKIKAAINFLKGGGKKVFITKAELYEDTLLGIKGTTIESD